MNIYDLEGKSVGKVELPECFDDPVRFDLIQRAVVALQTAKFQPQGRDPMAGKRTTAQSLGVGRAMARVPRVKGDRYPRANLAAFAPSTVKGRLTFPPTSAKILDIMMLMITMGGKERTKDEFAELFASSGLRLNRIVPTEGPICVIEAVLG